MLKAIKNFFKRESHVHHYTTNSTATLIVWQDCMYALLPDGSLYRITRDYDGQESITQIGYGR